jgi:octaprenyl-diphosphate synthase
MMTVEEIKAPITKELDEFEAFFLDSMRSNVPLLDKVIHYIAKRKGKQIRPMFVFLVARMLGGQGEKKTFSAAALVELLHTATLVHDDVVDDANERRGFFSVNALWKNKIAVLVGDYLLSRSLLTSIDNKDFASLEVIARAVKAMSEGELLQLEKSRTLDITEEVYMEVIRQKTGSLIAACCEAAAISVGREDLAEQMCRFGETIGLAFQIKDDIFDYGNDEQIGKPTGNDIRERKVTMPLIYALNHCDKKTKKELLTILKKYNEDKKKVKRAIEIVVEAGGVAYAHKKMMALKDEALNLIQDVPASPAKNALIGLVEYTTLRLK